MDFKVNGREGEVQLNPGTNAHIEVNVAAYLDPLPDESIRKLSFLQKPYWALERARTGNTRDVPLEVVVNGQPTFPADA